MIYLFSMDFKRKKGKNLKRNLSKYSHDSTKREEMAQKARAKNGLPSKKLQGQN